MPSPLASPARPPPPGAIRVSQLARPFSEQGKQLLQGKAARHGRRQVLFRESSPQYLRRQALAVAYALRPARIGDMPAMGALLLREALARSPALPEPSAALAAPDGLCGIARDLSVSTLVEAYARGLYPWSHAGPVKWWAPRIRCVGNPREIRVSKATRDDAKAAKFKFSFDRDFDAVIAACAGPRNGRARLTWITPRIMWAFAA